MGIVKNIPTAILSLYYAPMRSWEYCLGFIAGIISWLYGDLTIGFGILVFITFADFVTGLLKAGREGDIKSTKMSRTGYKLAAYAILIAILHVFFNHYLPIIPGIEPQTSLFPPTMLKFYNLVPHFVIAILVLRELNSNVENLIRGGYIPEATARWLGKILSRVGDSIQKKQENINTGTGVSDTDGEK